MEAYTLRTQKRKIKKKLSLIDVVFRMISAVCVFVFCNFVFIQMQQSRNEPVNQEYMIAMETFAPLSQAVTVESTAPVPPKEARTRTEPDRSIDFNGLIAANSDIYAWISIPGTNIDYPVLYCGDNAYYLSHNALNEESKSGAIFSDMRNQEGFRDPVTVLYGHRMNDGSMFAQLHKFEDVSFFNQNRIIKIYTPQGEWEYRIFAAYQTDDSNILYGKDFTDRKQYQLYLDGLKAIHDTNANIGSETLTVDNYILTLSTCVKDDEESRFIVQAILR